MCVVLLFCCGKSAGWKLLTQPALLPLRTVGYIVVYCMFVSHCRIVLLSVVFYFNVFFSVSCKFCDFSLRATILINMNLNLNESENGNIVLAVVPVQPRTCTVGYALREVQQWQRVGTYRTTGVHNVPGSLPTM